MGQLTKLELPVVAPEGMDKDKTILILMLILNGLTNLVFSKNVWILSYYSAVDKCKELGITSEEFELVRAKFDEFRIARKRRNPMSCLHEEE